MLIIDNWPQTTHGNLLQKNVVKPGAKRTPVIYRSALCSLQNKQGYLFAMEQLYMSGFLLPKLFN